MKENKYYKEVIKALENFACEDKKKNSVFLVIADKETSSTQIIGVGKNLICSLASALENKDTRKIIKRAVLFKMIDNLPNTPED